MHSEPISLTTLLARIPGVPENHAAALSRLDIRALGQLVATPPTRYEEQREESDIASLELGPIVSARGEVSATKIHPRGRVPRFEAVLMDHSGRLDLVWFNQLFHQQRIFPGMRMRVTGQAKRIRGMVQMANPGYEVLKPEGSGGDEPGAREARVRPVYAASEQITSRQIEHLVGKLLARALPLIDDHLPEPYRKSRELLPLRDAYRLLHQPETLAEAAEARRRLAFDEFLLLQLGVFMRRAQVRSTTRAVALTWSPAIDSRIRARIPFTLTPDQDEVVGEVAADLARPEPATRLIQGDVGSGKTVIALYAMLMAVASGHQAALMAPTEILAEQHWASISRFLQGSEVRVELLTAGVGPNDRSAALWRIARGESDLVIGTHAVISESVRFRSLAVAVVDEQHRFGVEQRAALRAKGAATAFPPGNPAASVLFPVARAEQANPAEDTAEPLTPHVLVMTATPIPRTLALTVFGDLDVSTIRHLPPGRQPISTRVVGPSQWEEVYRLVRARLDAGEQAYIVVPAIDSGRAAATPGEEGESESAVNDLRTLEARLAAPDSPLAGRTVASLHGRMARHQREKVMQRFREGAVDALLATTVIEVGVDVPNASVMVIEHAERFGLAQLHQLRGRVGRGTRKSTCILIADTSTPDAAARLAAIADSTDGFALAEKDLELRGPGEVFGRSQSGMPPFRIADLMRDRELLGLARRDAEAWIRRSPGLEAPGEELLRRRLIKAHGKWLGLGDIG